MIRADFQVELASWQVDEADLRAEREAVFLVEQAIPPEEEWDALDLPSRHVLVRAADGQPIGTGRLVPPAAGDDPAHAHIGRMAVLADWRGKGVGAAIMRVLLEQARALGYGAVKLHAQSHAIPFYAQFGFAPCSEEYLECAIPHRTMRLDLDPVDAPPRAGPGPRPQAIALVADDRAQALAAVATLLAEAQHEVAIYTRDLDPALFDVPATLDALKRIALSGRHARVRILIHDPRSPVANGHRLIALAQRLSSAITLRTPVEERDQQYPSAFLLNDRSGYLFRPLGSRLEGEGSTHAPGRHAQLRDFFDQVWERSEPSPELRQLGI